MQAYHCVIDRIALDLPGTGEQYGKQLKKTATLKVGLSVGLIFRIRLQNSRNALKKVKIIPTLVAVSLADRELRNVK